MNCFSELDYSIYADGESSPEEARLIEAHLESCGRCRVLADVLRAENLLFSLLLSKQEAKQPAASKAAGWSWIVASLAAMAVVWQAASSWFNSLEMPAVVGWFNPSGGDVMWNLAFSALFSSGTWENVIAGLITGAWIAALGGALVLAAWFIRRWAPASALAAVSLALAFLMVLPAQAIERRRGDVVTVPKGQTVNDTLVAMGEEVEIEGNVNGDVIAFARRVAVRGNVSGDVVCFARDLDIGGEVEGNIYSFAKTARLQGLAERSLFGFAHRLELQNGAQVRHDLVAFAEEAELGGGVGRDVVTFTAATSLRGKIGRNFTAKGDRITLTPTARVAGDFNATVRNKDRVKIEDGAVISGKSDVQVRAHRSRYSRPGFYFWSVVTLIGAWIIGLLIAMLFPGAFAFASGTTSELGWKAGIGFLVVVVTPIAALILCLTLIGLPLGLITFVLWLIVLYLAKIFVGVALAQVLFKPANTSPRALAVPLLASLALIWILVSVPILGGLMKFLICITGAGMIFMWAKNRLWSQRPAAIA